MSDDWRQDENFHCAPDSAQKPAISGTSSTTGSNPACSAIEFALSRDCEEPIEFLRCWNEGDFDSIREEWPEAPESVFIGADPKHPSTRI